MTPRHLVPSACFVEKEHKPSDRWMVKFPGCTDSVLLDDRLDKWIQIHKIQPPIQGSIHDASFDLVVGPIFSHSAIKMANTDQNIALALSRITSSVDESIDGVQELLFKQPPRYIRRMSEALLHHHRDYLSGLEVDWFDMLYLYADQPHPKRKLRLQAVLEIDALCLFDTRNAGFITFISSVKTKLKRFEWAKPGKNPRNIIDLSVVGSLVAGFAAEQMKKSLASFCYSSKRTVKFVPSATYENLKQCFVDLKEQNFAFRYFSDDGCLKAICSDGELMANLDITSCDATLTKAFFNWVSSTIPEGPWKSWLLGAVAQLKLPVKVKRANGRTLCKLTPNRYSTSNMCLFSGSILTTFEDCMANLLIGETLSRVKFDQLTRAQATVAITEACRQIGFKVTVDIAENFQQLQFLKFSPNSSGEPWWNAAPLFRTIGICKGGVIPQLKPGWKSLSQYEKSMCWNSSLLEGMKYSGNTEYYKILAEKFNLVTGAAAVDKLEQLKQCAEVDRSDVQLRYDLTDLEYDELIDMVTACGVGTIVRCRALDKIYHRDYGYKAPEHTFEECVDPIWTGEICYGVVDQSWGD